MDHPLHLLTLIPAQNEADRQTLLTYIHTAPLAPDHWKVLKTIYKQYEATPDEAITAAIITRLDQAPTSGLEVTYPTTKTIGYMKRRARRFMNAIQNPALYFQITSRVLLAHSGKGEVNFDHQWITADILLGNSRRLRQHGHGRGKVEFNGLGFHHTWPEDRRPDVWNDQLPFLKGLLVPDIPWAIQEFALKVLMRNGVALPPLSPVQITRFFGAPSLVLRQVAARQAYAAWQAGKTLSPAEWAGLFTFTNAARRRDLLQSDWAKQPQAWQAEVAARLQEYISGHSRTQQPSRRIIAALSLLHTLAKTRFKPDQVLSVAGLLFASGQKGLEEWAFTAAEKADKEHALDWLNAAASDHQASRLAQLFLPKYKRAKFTTKAIEPFVLHPSFVVCRFGWELVRRHSQDEFGAVGSIWSKLVKAVGKPKWETALRNTIQADAAAEVFTRYYTQYEHSLGDHGSFPRPAFAFVLKHGNEPFRKFLFGKLLQWFRDKPLLWLPLLAQCPGDVRKELLQRTTPVLRSYRLFNTETFLYAVRNTPADNAWFWETLLYLMDNCVLPEEDVKTIFECAAKEPVALEKLIAHAALLTNPGRREWFLAEIGRQLERRPELVAQTDAEVAAQLLRNATPGGLTVLISTLSEAGWQQIRPVLHERIQHLPHPGAFWREALGQVAASEKGDVLAVRLFGDPGLLALFLQQPDAVVLDVQHPAVEAWLGQWTGRHLGAIARHPDSLYRACTHKLPAVRTPALAGALTPGLDLAFVVRLLESGLPPVQQAVGGYLEGLPAGSSGEWDAVLALCDSPDRATRSLGITFLQRRQPQWPDERRARLLEFLSEHADPQVHRLVSEGLLAQPLAGPFVQRFDQEVLRMKNRSRQAKENVKKRQEQNPSLPTGVLLEMARGNGKKEAEWAIWQLTQRALAGESIPGFELK